MPDVVEREGVLDGKGVRLYRRSIGPISTPWARLAIVHGYGDHGGRHVHFMRWMAQRGVECHAVDLRGQGAADGRRGFVARWEEYLDDLQTFASSLPADDGLPLFLLGHSHGGLIVAAALIARLPSLNAARGVVLTSPYFRSKLKIPRWKVLVASMIRPFAPWMQFGSGVLDEWLTSDPQMIEQTHSDPHYTRAATPGWYFGHLAAQRNVMDHAAQFQWPMLLLAGGADPIADPQTSRQFFDNAGSTDKEFVLLENARHELLRETSREAIFEQILTWMRSRAASSGAKPERA